MVRICQTTYDNFANVLMAQCIVAQPITAKTGPDSCKNNERRFLCRRLQGSAIVTLVASVEEQGICWAEICDSNWKLLCYGKLNLQRDFALVVESAIATANIMIESAGSHSEIAKVDSLLKGIPVEFNRPTLNNVRLIRSIPKRRLQFLSGDPSNRPQVGDLGETDHCSTGFWGQIVDVYVRKRDPIAYWMVEAYLPDIQSVIASRADVEALYDANAEDHLNETPWTILAYPTSIADRDRLPPDIDVQMLLGELQQRGIPIGVWNNEVTPDTTYVICHYHDRERVAQALTELEKAGIIEPGFLKERAEELHSFRNTILPCHHGRP